MNQKRSNHKIIIWSTSISDLLNGRASGIAVQLFFWAQTFVRHDWQVTTFSCHKAFSQDGIFFKKTTRWGKFEVVHEWLSVFWRLLTIRPHLVFYRGADRAILPIAIVSRWFGIKFVFLGASDSDFTPGRELVVGFSTNRRMYQMAIGRIQYIVTQNKAQHDALLQNYGKESLVLPNIWLVKSGISLEKQYDAVWVANFRPLKRAEWFVRLAKSLPQFSFAIIGGVSSKDYYDQIKEKASEVGNLSFLGAKTFEEVNSLIAESRLLICTSEFEGFPNTFLQAWAQSVPVISTVNPNSCITEFDLGRVVDNESELLNATEEILSSKELLEKYKKNIDAYFLSHHDANVAYQKILEQIHFKK